MEDILYKKLIKHVGKKKDALLRIELEVQTNHIKLKLSKLSPISTIDSINRFNSLKWEDKLKEVLRESNISDVTSLTEDDIRNLVSSHIKSFQEKVVALKSEDEFEKNILDYTGPSLYLVKWLYTFSNEILHDSVMEFVPAIVSKIDEVERPLKIEKDSLPDNYILYMGPKEKYRGCVGEIVDTRPDNENPTLIYCEKTAGGNNASGKLWCSDCNLMIL